MSSRVLFIVRREAPTSQDLGKGPDETVESERRIVFRQTLYPNSYFQAGPASGQSIVNTHGVAQD